MMRYGVVFIHSLTSIDCNVSMCHFGSHFLTDPYLSLRYCLEISIYIETEEIIVDKLFRDNRFRDLVRDLVSDLVNFPSAFHGSLSWNASCF
jgi:hypothetical protein